MQQQPRPAQPEVSVEPEGMPKALLIWLIVGPISVIAIATAFILRPQHAVVSEVSPQVGPATAQTNGMSVSGGLVDPPGKLAPVMDPVRPAATPLVPESVPAPTPPKVVAAPVQIKGAAWITRAGGTSDLLRGMRVSLLKPSVPAKVVDGCIRESAKGFLDDEEMYRRFAKNAERYPDLQKTNLNYAEEYHARYEAALEVGRKCSGDFDLAEAFALVQKNSNRVPNFASAVATTLVKDTKTNVDGKYVLDQVPRGVYYVHALFTTTESMIEWVTPVDATEGSVDLDLDNENAIFIRNIK